MICGKLWKELWGQATHCKAFCNDRLVKGHVSIHNEVSISLRKCTDLTCNLCGFMKSVINVLDYAMNKTGVQ